MANNDHSKLLSLLGINDVYVPYEPPSRPRVSGADYGETTYESPPDAPAVERFKREVAILQHYQDREIERIEQYQKQNLEMSSGLVALADAVTTLAKKIDSLEIPAVEVKVPPVEVKVHERIDPIKVEIKAPEIKIDQKPVKVEVELKQPKSSATKSATIKHADGTTSTVELK